MAAVSVSELRSKIKHILKGADLASLSAKKVRLQLQTDLGTDLSERKKEIDKLTMELILAKEDGEDSDDDKNNVANGKDSESSSSSDEIEDESPPQKKAKIKEKVVKTTPKKISKPVTPKTVSTLDDDSDDDKLNDEELAQRLQAEEEEEGGRRTRHRSVKKTPVRKKTPKKERKKREQGTSTYSRPCLLSPELAKVMGTDKMARNEVVKRIWEIKKERNLHDQKDKRFMICDDELLSVFGRRRVQTFGMMKYLKNHIKDVRDVAPTSVVDEDEVD